MLLDEFTIHSFRGLRDLTLKGLGRVNLLVGPNNSGKTSVLEAIDLFLDPLNKSNWFDAAMRRQPIGSLVLIQNLRWLFPQAISSIELSALGAIPTTKMSAFFKDVKGTPAFSENNQKNGSTNPASILPQPGMEVTISINKDFHDDPSEKTSIVFFDSDVFLLQQEGSISSIPRVFLYPLSPVQERLTYGLYGELIERNLKPLIARTLKIFDPDIEDIEGMPDPNTKGYFKIKHRRLGYPPLTAFGDGIRKAFIYVINLIPAMKGLLLIDEIENSIHASALQEILKHLMELAKIFEIQLFATTHSLEAVDAILSAELSDPESIVVYRLSPENQIRPVLRYGQGELVEMRHELGLDIR